MKLEKGEYFGELLHKFELPGAVLTETQYEPNSTLPEHSHDNDYICFALSGVYDEIWDETECKVQSGTLLFHPKESQHANRFAQSPARCFNIELLPESADLFELDMTCLGNQPVQFFGEINFLAEKLYREVQFPDRYSQLAINSLLVEIFIGIARTQTETSTNAPRSHQGAIDFVKENFKKPLRIGEVAAALGLDSINLARSFREHENCSFQEYLNRIRLDHVCQQLVECGDPIGHIAVSAGFYDQSHLTRTFKRSLGLTPREFRRQLRSN